MSSILAVGDRLPAVTLFEFNQVKGTYVRRRAVAVQSRRGCGQQDDRRLCLARCVHADVLGSPSAGLLRAVRRMAARVDEIWCLSVNDAFVMGAWGDQLVDGDATFAKAAGLQLDLTSKGLGLRSARSSMLVKDGLVMHLNVGAKLNFEVSDAATILVQVRGQ